MYHSITIGTKNTWDDWHMIPVSRPVVAPPIEKVITVDVSGKNGSTYLSKSVTGYPVFKSREGLWEFYLDTDAWRGENLSGPIGAGALGQISKWLLKASENPMRLTVRLEDDPAFFYYGRVWVSGGLKQQQNHSVVTLKYSLYPFKYLCASLLDDWLWDDFGFETDLALPYLKEIEIPRGTSVRIYLPPSEKPSVVQIGRVSGFNFANWFGSGAATLYKSKRYPYVKALKEGLYHTSSTVSFSMLGLSSKYDIGIIDNDLRYDVYELEIVNTTPTALAGNVMKVSVFYKPAYI